MDRCLLSCHQETESGDSCLLTSFDQVVKNVDHPGYLAFRIAVQVFILGTVVLSAGAWFSVWHYERFGGDPQKRNILNQLIGMLAANGMIWQNISFIVAFSRLIFGPLSVDLTSMVFVYPTVIGDVSILCILNEIMILRCLSVCLWKQSPPLSDDFFGFFLRWLNFGFAFLMVTFGQMGGSPTDNIYFIMTGIYHHREPLFSVLK